MFDCHYLHACGAFSKISSINDRSVKYELYLPSSEERFNKALHMLLYTVQRFVQNHVIQYRRLLEDKKEVQLYPIEAERIGKSSIKYSGDHLEQWTRACKCLLTQLQWITYIIKLRDDFEQKQNFSNEPIYAQTFNN